MSTWLIALLLVSAVVFFGLRLLAGAVALWRRQERRALAGLRCLECAALIGEAVATASATRQDESFNAAARRGIQLGITISPSREWQVECAECGAELEFSLLSRTLRSGLA